MKPWALRQLRVDAAAAAMNIDTLRQRLRAAQDIGDWKCAYRIATWIDARHGQGGAIAALGGAWPGVAT